MTEVALNLVVIRSADLDRALWFYGLLGITFTRERHGSGPEHLASQLGSVVLEIYPREDMPGSEVVRLGFQVLSVDATVATLQDAGVIIVAPPKDSPWGRRAIVVDPDGHRVEITDANA